MIHIPLWKTILVIGVCLLGIVFVSPNFFTEKQLENLPGWFPKNTLVLGLDLQGGAHLLLEVDFEAALQEQMNTLSDAIRTTLRKERIGYTGLSAKKDFVTLILRDPTDIKKATDLITQTDHTLQIKSTPDGQLTFTLNETTIRERKKSALAQSIEIIRRRVDETGTKEPSIQSQGDNQILVQLPGLKDPWQSWNR